MKVCEKCGDEIGTKDGDNECVPCMVRADLLIGEKARKRTARNAQRRAREDALRSVGLVKVRGALGGTYWE